MHTLKHAPPYPATNFPLTPRRVHSRVVTLCSDQMIEARPNVSSYRSLRGMYSPVYITMKHNPITHHCYNGINQDNYVEIADAQNKRQLRRRQISG